ncbi:Uncharacterised protein [Mycobacteroides abscessus subsp. abscessus]|nr:Uncharacterised protein [Mycobacteroides abscessus subsp. abscessus]
MDAPQYTCCIRPVRTAVAWIMTDRMHLCLRKPNIVMVCCPRPTLGGVCGTGG